MSKRKGLTIGKVRSWLYRIARLLGDVSSVQHRRIGKRIARRAAGKLTGRVLGRFFK